MAKLDRKTQKLFAENSPNDQVTTFGSPTLDNPVFSKDPAQIQTAEYSNGFFPTILDGAIRPYAEDMNGLFYLISYQLKYIFEQGLSEYDANTTYYINSLVKQGTEIYLSIADNNKGNNPSSSVGYWIWFAGLNDPNALPVGTIQDYAGETLTNARWMFCRGQTISRTDYAKLFSVIGTRYGSGDGATTFNLPDLRQRFVLGLNSSGAYATLGATGGAIDHNHIVYGHKHGVGNLSITGASGSHTHAITDNGHTHATSPHRHQLQFSDYHCQENKVQGVNVTDVTHDGAYSSRSPTITENTTVTVQGATTGITIAASTHTHATSSFSGTVGNVNGQVGDNNQVTSTNNPPYIILNKIIKVF